MQAQVSKWGHSLALRLPKAIAEGLGGEGARVDMHVETGKVIIEPMAKRRYRLEDLIKGMASNRHRAVKDGPSVGNEKW